MESSQGHMNTTFNNNNFQSLQQYEFHNNYHQESHHSLDNITHPQEPVHEFFIKMPDDSQIYYVICEEKPVSFELVSQILNNDCFSTQENNSHEFHFLNHYEEKCYKVTCKLVSHSSIVRYLNHNIYGIKQNSFQEEYVEFPRELKENLECYLKQFLSSE